MLPKFSQIVNRLYAFIYETNHSKSGLGLPSIVALVMVIDKSWTSLGKHEKAFYTGLKKFVDDCKPLVDSAGNIRCPCKSCRLVLWVSIKHLSDHISKYGFDPSYKTWIHHGEPDLPPPPPVRAPESPIWVAGERAKQAYPPMRLEPQHGLLGQLSWGIVKAWPVALPFLASSAGGAEGGGHGSDWEISLTCTLERIRLSRPSHISEVNWDAQIAFWNDPKNRARAAQNKQNRAKSKVVCRQGSRSNAALRDMHMESSATREYPSLIHTFFLTHTVNGILLNPEDKALYEEMLRLQGLGSNTKTGMPYTEDEIMAIFRRGKQRGYIPGVGRVLPGQGTVISPPPPCTHSSDVVKLKNVRKGATASPEIGGGSGSGGRRDDEQGDDDDDGEDGEDEDDS
ncbi:ankyrin repeat-containing protein [Tanacetum coccineum]